MRILGVISSSSREVPNAPTIGTATDVGTSRAYNNGAATVTFTAPTWNGGLPITSYTVTSSPGGFTGTGSASPITVTGLASSTSYTFTVTATNGVGTSAASAASNSITATTVPQAPTIGTATAGNGSATVTYTAGATGGKTVTTYTATSSPGSLTGTGSSPITVSGLTNGTAYTFTVTATNANGTSAASSASNSVTPVAPVLGAWSTSTQYPLSTISESYGNANGSLFYIGGGLVNGTTPTATGYSWTTSWSSLNMPTVRYQHQTQRLTTSGSTNSLMMLGGYDTTGFASSSKATILSGSTFSSGTNYPVAYPGIGFASLDGNGNVRANGGNTALGYYTTSFGGSWTSTGVNSPVTASNLFSMVDNNFNGEAFLFNSASTSTGLLVYKCTSTTSAWTSVTGLPFTAGAAQPWISATVISSTVMIFGARDNRLNPYTFNGTTYTSQTAITVPNGNQGNIGAIGNILNYIRIAATTNTNENVHLVATFA